MPDGRAGRLVEQWQEELAEKFGLEFEILTRDTIEASRSGNPFVETARLWIARLDQLSRKRELQRSGPARWTGIWSIVDEAHKM